MNPFRAIATRNVSRNKRRSAVTMASIAFGVAAVLVMEAYAQGFLGLMVDSVVKARSGAIQIHKTGYMKNRSGNPAEFAFPYEEDLAVKIRRVAGVTALTRRVTFTGMITNGRNQTMFAARSLDLATEKSVCPNAGEDLEEGGESLTIGDHAATLVGAELAQSMSAFPARLKALSADPNAVDILTLSSTSPEGRQNSLDVTVKGTMKSLLGFESKRVITVPIKLAQELLGLGDRITEIAVAIDDLTRVDAIRDQLSTALGADFEVHDWQEANPFVRDILERQKILMGIVSTVLFVIVVFGVTNTMLMSVYERVREIGTMLSVGVRRKQVATIFVWEGLTIAVLGCAAGLVLGWVALKALVAMGVVLPSIGTTRQAEFYPEIALMFALKAVAMTTIGAALASLWPAVKAARLDPVEALRST